MTSAKIKRWKLNQLERWKLKQLSHPHAHILFIKTMKYGSNAKPDGTVSVN